MGWCMEFFAFSCFGSLSTLYFNYWQPVLPSERVVVSNSTLHVARSAERVLSLLDAVVSAGALSLGEAAKIADLPISTALRHLKTLELNGYLTRAADGSFSVGPTFLRLAVASLEASPMARLILAAQPHLDALTEATGESSYLAVLEHDHALYLATAESPRAIRHAGWVGRTVPLDTTAVGAALNGKKPGSAHCVISAVEPDVSAAVAAVTGPKGAIVAALSVLGPSQRLTGKAMKTAGIAVLKTAGALSVDLAGEQPS